LATGRIDSKNPSEETPVPHQLTDDIWDHSDWIVRVHELEMGGSK